MGVHDLIHFPKPFKYVFFQLFYIIYMKLNDLTLKTRFSLILTQK